MDLVRCDAFKKGLPSRVFCSWPALVLRCMRIMLHVSSYMPCEAALECCRRVQVTEGYRPSTTVQPVMTRYRGKPSSGRQLEESFQSPPRTLALFDA
jgi:hypothetical protein